MKFILEEIKENMRPVRVFLEQDSQGDVALKATDGDITVRLAWLIASGPHKGEITLCQGDEIQALGFVVDNEGAIKTY